MTTSDLSGETCAILGQFGIAADRLDTGEMAVHSPIDGAVIGRLATARFGRP